MLSSNRILWPTHFGKALNLIFPKFSSQNMGGFDHDSQSQFPQSPQWPAFCVPKFRGVLPEKLGGGVQHASWNCDFPCPISDLIKNLIPYFRPEVLEPGSCRERVTSCYGTYTVVGVNIKREMVLSPNDEELPNSSKKHTQFKTRVHKPYPISDENGRNWYPISDQNG